ncbi:MAG TPA: 2,3-diaminopropionate biosynthesis protein SbnB [Thermoanaerobaculia bacterium]|jgi:ornithine cyclodeaminase|nr:2,3-diaminopropionate biosynthesis protein SbnB [Thermoanaerobaculia bacterium]
MPERDLTIISGSAVRQILEDDDLVLRAVTDAYLAHARGQTQTPGTQPLYANGGRFFAMPASIEDERPIIGVKWVASFVRNVSAGAERAAAMLIVNDAMTGKPVAIVDGTVISAKRTAAAAAVALRGLAGTEAPASLALVGCGPINYEILRFIAHLFPLQRVLLVDLDPSRVDRFANRVKSEFPQITPSAASLDQALEEADVVSFATNATTPYVPSLPKRSFTVLHISLRDLAPEIIAGAYNVVDDVEHVCSARTSVHLAEQATGTRDFIRGTIPDLLNGTFRYERPDVPTIVSPFGMAILDLAVLREVLAHSTGDRKGLIRVENFSDSVWQ